MSVAGQEGVEGFDRIEQHQILERASVEPEVLDESSPLFGLSKRPFPRRVMLLCAIMAFFVLSAISSGTADIDIIYRLICYLDGIEQKSCFLDGSVNNKVAGYSAVVSIITGCSSLLMSTYLSVMSDRLGRKPILVGAMTLSGIAQVVSWYIVFHLPNPTTYWILLIPTVIESLGGGVMLVLRLSVAYISDMVPDVTHRTRLVAVTDGLFFGALAVGPSLGSFIIRGLGIESLYVMTSIGMLLSAVVSSWYLKESLSHYHKRRNSTNKVSVTSSFKLLRFDNVEDKKSRRNARVLLVCSILATELAITFMAILALYPRRKFGWSAIQLGYLISIMSSTRTLWFLFLFPFFYSKLSKVWRVFSDRIDRIDIFFIRLSLLFSISGLLLMGWSRTEKQYFASGVVDACSAIGKSVFTASLIKYLPQGQYGSFMAAFNFLCALFSIIAPALFLKLYTWASDFRPSLPFEVVSGMFFCILLFTLLLKPAL